ncbi:MAG: hypothetical protein ACOX22_02680 [Caldicoprobacterales bacterium]
MKPPNIVSDDFRRSVAEREGKQPDEVCNHPGIYNEARAGGNQ